MMNKILFIFLSTLLLGGPAVAQRHEITNTLLWEISGKDLKKPSYLFGTYHFAGKDFVDTMKVLQQKLNTADAVVGELIMSPEVALTLMSFMTMKDNTLDKLLNADEYQQVSSYLKNTVGIDLRSMNTMKPLAIQAFIMQFHAPKTISTENPAIEEYFQDFGKAAKKEVIGLETVKEQATLLFGAPLLRQKERLLKSINEAEKNKKEGRRLFDAYVAQDLNILEALFAEVDDVSPEEFDALLKDRNQKWMEKLPMLMQEKSLFIAVGAGHLIGTNGLIALLRKSGYTVNPLPTGSK